jgi:hypothetical protein
MLVGQIFGVNNFCPETVCRRDNCSVPIRNVLFSFQRDRFENEIAIDRGDWKASQALDELQRRRLSRFLFSDGWEETE